MSADRPSPTTNQADERWPPGMRRPQDATQMIAGGSGSTKKVPYSEEQVTLASDAVIDIDEPQKLAASDGRAASSRLANAAAASGIGRAGSSSVSSIGRAGSSIGTPGAPRLGPYELIEKLGQGGMGTVWKARHLKLDRVVALKVLPPAFVRSEDSVARFEREMRAVGKLNHPNIVQAYDAGECDGIHYIAMEFVDGRDLQKLVRANGAFSVTDAASAVRQAALGLAAAHVEGLVHRDVKPSNLLRARNGQIKVLDLGLALLAAEQEEGEAITTEGQSLGTPDFMAPEQWEDTHSVDPRTDVYALGCTLFYLLAGRAPFEGDQHRTLAKKMLAHLDEAPPSLLAVRPEAPPALDAAVRRMMAKAPRDRFQSAAEVAEVLLPFSGEPANNQASTTSSIAAIPPPPPAATQSQGSSSIDLGLVVANRKPKTAPAPAVPVTVPKVSNRTLAIALAISSVLLLAIMVMLIVAASRGGRSAKRVPKVVPVEPEPTRGGTSPRIKHPPILLASKEELPPWKLPADAPFGAVAPFTPAEGRAHRERWAQYLKQPIFDQNSIGMKLALIPPGEFTLYFDNEGDPQFSISRDKPNKKVRISQPYYLSATEVTWDQFRQFVEATGYKTAAETSGNGSHKPDFSSREPNLNWRTPGFKEDDPLYPVTDVTWNDAQAFCRWLSEKEGAIYRLPTAAEWTFASRAGNLTSAGVCLRNEDVRDYAWPKTDGVHVQRVGQKQPSVWGLFDTLGNVWEWTADRISTGSMHLTPAVDPVGAWPGYIRGGSYADDDRRPEVTYNYGGHEYGPNVGFRVLRQTSNDELGLLRPRPLAPTQPLAGPLWCAVQRPAFIPGVQSWSVEPTGVSGRLTALAWSPLGDLIATADDDGAVRLWNTENQLQKVLLGHEGTIERVVFSPDGKLIASCHHNRGGAVRVCDVATGQCLLDLKFNDWIRHIAFASDGRLAISNHTFIVVDPRTGQIEVAGGPGTTRGLAWSPDASQVVAPVSGGLQLWDGQTLQPTQKIPVQGFLGYPEWSPNGRLVAAWTDAGITIWDTATWSVLQTLKVQKREGNNALAWAPDNRRLIVLPGPGGERGIWDAKTGEQIAPMNNVHEIAAAWSPTGEQVVGVRSNRPVIQDAATGKDVHAWPDKGCIRHSPYYFSPDGSQIAASVEGIRIWSSEAPELLKSLNPTITGGPRGWSADGQYFALANSSSLWLIDLQSGAAKHELKSPTGNVLDVVWSPDGKRLAVADSGNVIRVWNQDTAKQELELKGHTGFIHGLDWSPSGDRLASLSHDKSLRVWDAQSGKTLGEYKNFPEDLNGYGWETTPFSWTANGNGIWVAMHYHASLLDLKTGAFGPQENFSNGNNFYTLLMSPDRQRFLTAESYGWCFLRGETSGDRRMLDQSFRSWPAWHPDSRRLIAAGSHGYDTHTAKHLGKLFPYVSEDNWLCVGPHGHYRGSDAIDEHIVYVALLEDGSQITLTPSDFATRFAWTNDVKQATLLKLDEQLAPAKN